MAKNQACTNAIYDENKTTAGIYLCDWPLHHRFGWEVMFEMKLDWLSYWTVMISWLLCQSFYRRCQGCDYLPVTVGRFRGSRHATAFDPRWFCCFPKAWLGSRGRRRPRSHPRPRCQSCLTVWSPWTTKEERQVLSNACHCCHQTHLHG